MTITKNQSKDPLTDHSLNAELNLPGRVVTTGWVADHLEHPSLRLLDVREAAHVGEGHLPGAVHVELQTLSGIVEGVPGMLLPPAEFAAQIERLGIRSGVTVVAYDDNWGLAAARVLWALTRYGVAQAGLLTGGWDQWQAEGRPISSQAADPLASAFVAQRDERSIATWSWISEHLDKPDVVIVDVRGDKEFGDGHIPNAVHWDWMNAVPVGSWEAMRPDADLSADLAKAGITPDKEIITYCRSGVRAAHTYWALRHLGYPRVRNYDGSWLEWQSLSHLPIETEE
jgi:thiosulfate/3-mercaptopyruvate sulfurtransferase